MSRTVSSFLSISLSLWLAAGCAGRKAAPATSPEPAADAPTATAPPPEGSAQTSPAPPSQANPVEPEARAPELTLHIDEGLNEDLIRARLLRGRALLESIDVHLLDSASEQQRKIGGNLLADAEQALADGDPGRANVLSEKALVLLEDLHAATRPD